MVRHSYNTFFDARIRDRTGDVNGLFQSLTPIVPDTGINGTDNTKYRCKADAANTSLDWEEASFTFVPAAGVTKIRFFVWSNNTAANFLDEASIVEVLDVASGTTTISANTTYGDVNISAGANLVVNTGVTLTTNTINLESTSSSYASLISDGTITGTINYKRYSNVVRTGTSGGNDLISAPVSGQTFGSFATENTNLAASGIERAFAPFNNVSGAYENFDTTDNAATTIVAGQGYRAATTDGSNLTFTGTVNTGVVNVGITVGTTNAWNLIGNPYPSYIDFVTFFAANKTQFDTGSQAIYGYNAAGSV
ncbi:hypothetical protein [Polaribacter atrinae]|uniref:hypothetical protein n=1 Tax=Polaribacter atrinae TaxID=1333662 RepID=UPI002492275B|nr:hypothetical protein [Polaribacter atrinae]